WNNRLYVCEKISGALDEVSPDGTVQAFAAGLGSPMDLTFGTGAFGGQLYVAEADSLGPDTLEHNNAGRISKLESNGSRSSFTSGLNYPTSLIRSEPGSPFGDRLLVALYNQFDAQGFPIPQTGRIVALDPGGNMAPFADSLERPMDL